MTPCKQCLQAMTALLAPWLDCTSHGMAAPSGLNAWPLLERKKSPNRNATSMAADRADARRSFPVPMQNQNHGYCIALRFVVRFKGVAALSIVDPTKGDSDGAR